MTTLPPDVTLQQIDGGPNYYSNNGFTYAANAGWDNPYFFPIGVWYGMIITQADADRWHDLGLNTAFRTTGNTVNSILRANGIWAVEENGETPNMGSETVGLLTYDEPSTFAVGVTTPLSTTPNSVQDGRFWYINNTWNFIYYQGLNPISSSAEVLNTLVTTPNGTQRHIDEQSVDIYWFAGGKAPNSVLYQGGLLDHLGRNMTPDEAERGSNYGDMIDAERAFQVTHPAPIAAFIENGGPYTEDTSASDYITPPELNWAVWSSLIHGAREIIYFNHTFAGPAQSHDNLRQTFYQTIQPGQTISMYDQVKATDALIEQLAPVLNSPTALGYVTVSPTPTTFSGIETMAKYYNGQFYIFADTRDSETQTNIPATFTIKDLNATSVTVVDENRTIPVTNGVFTDTFARAWTVHIYQMNDGSSPPPPPPGGNAVVSATLVNADTDLDIMLLMNDMVLDFSNLPAHLSVRANTDPSPTGSVAFDLDGITHIENILPYAIAGDNQGDYNPWTPVVGMHTLVLTPYSGGGGTGQAGVPLAISFNVLPPSSPGNAVVSATLVDADTDTDIQPLQSGMTLNLAALPTQNLSVRANTEPSPTGSVVFDFDGVTHIENILPYAIAGDFPQGDYTPWTPEAGSHSLVMTPYSGPVATGQPGAPLTIHFDILA